MRKFLRKEEKMFKLFENQKPRKENRYVGEIRATQDGEAISLSTFPDAIIRDGILGGGMAIIPRNGRVVSPVDGTVTTIAKSGHAFCFETSDGIGLLVHIGVDTVVLNGNGFDVLVKEGDYVLAGTPICDVDLALLEARNIPAHTAILLPSHSDVEGAVLGCVQAGVTTVIHYQP